MTIPTQNPKNILQNESFQVGLFLLFSIFLAYNALAINLREINFWDEAVYLNTGRSLFLGELPPFSRNPLIGVFYALTYLPFSASHYWMTQSAMLGRFFLFTLMWISGYLVAREATEQKTLPFIFAALLIFSPVLVEIVGNPSDALFSAMSAFALWQLLRFYHHRRTEALAKMSFFLGLSALSRNDGLVLFAIFMLIAILLAYKNTKKWKLALSALLPFFALVIGYLLIFGAISGSAELDTAKRTYVAFLQGHAVDYQHDDSTCQQKIMKCVVHEAENIYGTAEENNASVFQAIHKNPSAYLSRLNKTIKTLPEKIVEAYGKRTVIALFLFTALGIFALLKKKEYLLLGIFFASMAYLGVYFLTFFRAGYFRMPYFIIFTLATFGVSPIVDLASKKKTALFFSGIFLALIGTGIILDLRMLYFTSALLLFALLTGFTLILKDTKTGRYATLFLLLFAFAIISGKTFDPPIPHPLGQLPEEEAIVLMQETFPENTPILAGAPGGAWAARMQYIEPSSESFQDIKSEEDLHNRLLELGVQAIYVDHHLSNTNQFIWDLIEPRIGEWYETAYIGREGSIRVLIVQQ